jgi:hypothetical protein
MSSDTRPERRFSGDGYLSRARYFSLCHDDGLDGGTVLRELTAYHDPISDGLMEIQDLTGGRPPSGDIPSGIGTSAHERPSGILLSIPPHTATQHDWLHDAVRRWETTTVLLSTRII